MDNLKPCPFCGNTVIRINEDMEGWIVFCSKILSCANGTTSWNTKEQAIKAWNRRSNGQD